MKKLLYVFLVLLSFGVKAQQQQNLGSSNTLILVPGAFRPPLVAATGSAKVAGTWYYNVSDSTWHYWTGNTDQKFSSQLIAKDTVLTPTVTTGTTYSNAVLQGAQITGFYIQGLRVDFTPVTGQLYGTFNQTTGTITLVNGTFSTGDAVAIVYQIKPLNSSAGSGSCIGCLLASNNLSDVLSASTALSNIGGNSSTNQTIGTLPIARIANNSLTLNKIVTGINNSLLGYDASGNPINITSGTNITISGGVISASGGSTFVTPGSTSQAMFNSNGTINGTSLLTFDTTANKTVNVVQGTGNPVTGGAALNVSATWNSGTTNFNGIVENITNTAASAASRLVNLQVSGSSIWSVDPSGNTFSFGGQHTATTAHKFIYGSATQSASFLATGLIGANDNMLQFIVPASSNAIIESAGAPLVLETQSGAFQIKLRINRTDKATLDASGNWNVLAGNLSSIHNIGIGSAPSTGSLGTNVTSATPTGTDKGFKLVVVTSGAVVGTICSLTWATAWANAPILSFSSENTATGAACSAMGARGTSTTAGTFEGVISGAGTYTFDFQTEGN